MHDAHVLSPEIHTTLTQSSATPKRRPPSRRGAARRRRAVRSQGGPRRAWPRRREEMVRARARARGATGTGRAAARHDASRRAPCAGACASIWRRRAYHVAPDLADGRLPGAHGAQLSYADAPAPASRAGARRRRRVGLGGAALGACWRSSALGSAPASRPSTRRGAGELGRAGRLSGAERPSRSGHSWLPDPPTAALGAGAVRRAPARRRRARDLRQSPPSTSSSCGTHLLRRARARAGSRGRWSPKSTDARVRGARWVSACGRLQRTRRASRFGRAQHGWVSATRGAIPR